MSFPSFFSPAKALRIISRGTCGADFSKSLMRKVSGNPQNVAVAGDFLFRAILRGRLFGGDFLYPFCGRGDALDAVRRFDALDNRRLPERFERLRNLSGEQILFSSVFAQKPYGTQNTRAVLVFALFRFPARVNEKCVRTLSAAFEKQNGVRIPISKKRLAGSPITASESLSSMRP